MKEKIKSLAMIATLLGFVLIFTTLERLTEPAEAEILPEPIYIRLETQEATEAEADASLENLSSGHVLPLTAEERELIERIVAGEARGESMECQMACAQAIRDRALEWDKPVTEICTAKWQFCEPYQGEISDRIKDAVRFTFDYGIDTLEYPVTHFYASDLITAPDWTYNKELRGEIDAVRFYY